MPTQRISKKIAVFLAIFLLSTNTLADTGSASYDDVVSWAVKKIVSWSPPGVNFYPDAKETKEEAIERYTSIASDAIQTAFDPNEAPVFGGPNGRIRTVALILSVAMAESGFRKDVDLGIGKHAKGDNGRSWCLSQIQLGVSTNGKTKTRIALNNDKVQFTTNSDDIGGEDLVKDRKKCFRVSLRMMRQSFGACSRLPTEERLASYASGSCSGGLASSRVRVRMAMKWLSTSPPPANDLQIIKLLMKAGIPSVAMSEF